METPEETYLLHLRSLRYDDYLWDADLPVGHEREPGVDCWRCDSLVDNPDCVHGVCYP